MDKWVFNHITLALELYTLNLLGLVESFRVETLKPKLCPEKKELEKTNASRGQRDRERTYKLREG